MLSNILCLNKSLYLFVIYVIMVTFLLPEMKMENSTFMTRFKNKKIWHARRLF